MTISASPAGGHRRHVQLTDTGHDLVRGAGAHVEQRLAEALATADVGYAEYASSTERLLAAVRTSA
ncbi:MAG: hypothetical protein V9G19_01545 [Tetrasphaera sp.]